MKGGDNLKSEIVCIVDRSGSMGSIADDAIGGFNTFLEDQKKVPGEATLTYVQFDHEIDTVLENKPLDRVEPIDTKTYQPRGTTALLDAVGTTIDSTGDRLNGVPEASRPGKVIVAILTDGMENASKKYTRSRIKEMIQHQKEKYNWEFIFLAANQDAFAEGAQLGIDKKDTFNFAATGVGVRSAYRNMSDSTTQYRT